MRDIQWKSGIFMCFSIRRESVHYEGRFETFENEESSAYPSIDSFFVMKQGITQHSCIRCRSYTFFLRFCFNCWLLVQIACDKKKEAFWKWSTNNVRYLFTKNVVLLFMILKLDWRATGIENADEPSDAVRT